jgi:hypothetical protein
MKREGEMLQKKDEGRPVRVQVEGVTLEGSLSIPEKTRALVVFVHGSGSSRFSPRNQYVAGDLQVGFRQSDNDLTWGR